MNMNQTQVSVDSTDFQDNNILTFSPQSNVTSAPQNNILDYNTQTQSYQQTLQITPARKNPPHPTIFFYRPPNDFCRYYVNCKEICYDTVTYLLNKSLKENKSDVCDGDKNRG